MSLVADLVTIVEPHADDAYLSLGWHIESWIKAGTSVRIVTVFGATRRRGADAERYAAAVGARSVLLPYVESGAGLRSAAEPTMPWGTADELRDQIPGGVGAVIWPLGLRHPEHRSVAAAAPRCALHYVEQPYASTAANGHELSTILDGRPVVSYLVPPIRKWRHHGLFKDQARYMFYNGPDKLGRLVELIVGGRP